MMSGAQGAPPVTVISGAARGIGEATAREFSEQGHHVVALDVIPPGSESLPNPRAEFYQCDVTDEDAVHPVIDRVASRQGRIDVLVNVAGVVLVKPLEETTWAEFQRVVSVNLGGTFLLCKYVLPVMKQRGRGAIVNVASVSGHVGQVDHSLYGATKGGVLAFTRALAWEVAPYHVRVNSVSPGSVDTPMLRGDIEIESRRTGLPFAEVKAKREAEQAFRRWADPAEIAKAIYFLASDAASFVTGTDLLVDCGWVAR